VGEIDGDGEEGTLALELDVFHDVSPVVPWWRFWFAVCREWVAALRSVAKLVQDARAKHLSRLTDQEDVPVRQSLCQKILAYVFQRATPWRGEHSVDVFLRDLHLTLASFREWVTRGRGSLAGSGTDPRGTSHPPCHRPPWERCPCVCRGRWERDPFAHRACRVRTLAALSSCPLS
jgi:hypothetical protein